MKIDIHTHTRKAKNGDAATRNISSEEFCRVVTSTDVKIIAITNHNIFDKQQYDEICAKLDDRIQVWPGIELDVLEDGKRGHLLVIVSPNKASDFSVVVNHLTSATTPDTFAINIQKTIESFDHLEPLYIAHYAKKPNLSDEHVNIIVEKTKNKNRVIKEVSNAISAGIFIEHGHRSIYGSDVQDWNNYIETSKKLPELRLPVESFEQFCLLLDKDSKTINTILDKKTPERISLIPFEDNTRIELTCYNDINIFFGSKGTGKTKILKAIEKHYNQKGLTAKVFIPDAGKLEQQCDLKGTKLQANLILDENEIEYCGPEIKKLREATEEDVTSISSYIRFFDTEITNERAKKILLKDYDPVNENAEDKKFKSYYKSLEKLSEFTEFIETDIPLKETSPKGELDNLILLAKALADKLRTKSFKIFLTWKQNYLFNSAVAKIKKEIERKAGAPAKPGSTGLIKYAKNRIEIEVNVKKILSNLNKEIKTINKRVGFLGEEKGELFCKTEIIFNAGKRDGNFSPMSKNINKNPQRDFIEAIEKIGGAVYSPDLFENIAKLNGVDQIDELTAIHKLLVFRRFFALADKEYKPSAGESSMLLLHEELETDKDVYILDEPEKSLGNDYISDVIVPLINEKAKSGKRVFISTHDANIAVRTLPYKSIYRAHGTDGYKTYVGNPFSNNLINIEDEKDQKDWKEISMKTLEGGKEAFGERGKIYGDL